MNWEELWAGYKRKRRIEWLYEKSAKVNKITNLSCLKMGKSWVEENRFTVYGRVVLHKIKYYELLFNVEGVEYMVIKKTQLTKEGYKTIWNSVELTNNYKLNDDEVKEWSEILEGFSFERHIQSNQ